MDGMCEGEGGALITLQPTRENHRSGGSGSGRAPRERQHLLSLSPGLRPLNGEFVINSAGFQPRGWKEREVEKVGRHGCTTLQTTLRQAAANGVVTRDRLRSKRRVTCFKSTREKRTALKPADSQRFLKRKKQSAIPCTSRRPDRRLQRGSAVVRKCR